MKNQEQIEKRIQKLENRIKDLWEQHDKSKNSGEFYVEKIEAIEKLIDVLNWVLGKEEVC